MAIGSYSDFEPLDIRLYQDIVENARVATGVRIVHLYRFVPERSEAVRLATSSLHSNHIRRGFQQIRRFFPAFHPKEVRPHVQANPLLRQIYLQGKTVAASVEEIAVGVVDPRIVALARPIVGISYVLSCPLVVQDRIYGALSFLHKQELTKVQRTTCEAFVRQVVLTMENAHLLRESQRNVEELQRSRVLLTQAEERLRRSVAESLHGEIQSQLLVAWHRLHEAEGLVTKDPEVARSLIECVRQILDRVREEDVRRVSHLLHPSIIQVGLVPALRSLIDSYSGNLKVHFQVDGKVSEWDDPISNRIPEQVRLALYRVVEEGLANTLRHANASEAWVTLTTDPENDTLEIQVSDNGSGLMKQTPTMGLGLASIDARVTPLGGEWSLRRNIDGTGTTLRARLPLRRSDHSDAREDAI